MVNLQSNPFSSTSQTKQRLSLLVKNGNMVISQVAKEKQEKCHGLRRRLTQNCEYSDKQSLRNRLIEMKMKK